MSSFDRARRLVYGYRAFQSVVAACELKIPDLLASGPMSSAEIAAATQTHEPSMRSLMRALCASEVFVQGADGKFAATETSDLFRSDRPGLRNHALMLSGQGYQAWANLLYTVRTGGDAFEHTFGKSSWEANAEDPDRSARFNAGMVESSARAAGAFLAAYDLSGVGTVVDVGGGNGALLSAILRARPGLRGVLFDLKQGLAGARQLLEADGVAARVTLVEGDFFRSVPEGADLYILKWIIHDWSDEKASAILRACRRSMADRSRLVLIERIIPELADSTPLALDATMADLHMRVALGGQERTVNEYRDLLAASGLNLTRVIPTDWLSVIEAVPAASS